VHEFSIAVEVGKIIEEYINEDLSNLRKITLKVGGLSGVVEEPLILALEAVLSSEYNATDVEIEIEEERALFKCDNCGESNFITPPLYICSSCGSTNGSVIGSSEILIKSLEVDDGKV